MKIALCSSTTFYDELSEVQVALEKLNHTALHPIDTAANMDKSLAEKYKDATHKTDRSLESRHIKNQLMRSHLIAIKDSDAVLIYNQTKNEVAGYIGGNVFLEMGFAFAYGKKIYLWNNMPEDSPFYDEISGMLPTVIHQDPTKII